ncbi:Acyl-CoA dehydrogenase [Saccharopolyspora antimicrobica]|uniref:Acyl-CoA dehydrogenase n=1 Tax=Saccharopolyspora antimicrobica TaxID=455193 RepID=A0A1I4VWQ2_9PSEU|nr:acyl-CoA dehydrogenase family protein [Saccharopolyspora antimicrobica]RKT87177.1 alkylation response protein AidB-like acyl-CoA dehydrogenase [Saccharopolyspora antimicrobica]SFN05590.1 Acyl-CoA dehydrogenase [Saccharopolyspora antimicrobica]
MAHEVVRRVEEVAARLAATAEDSERLGRLADESVKLVREAGVMRLLQPTDFGGYAAHPRDFAEAVMAVAKACGSTGWVCGVGGVHPWEMALMDRQLQQEVWGENPDTWIASPYMPSGIATPTNGGYVLKGRWQFSSGTDHCDWIFLGALVGDAGGKPAQPSKVLHVVLPRQDYTIVDDSWDVIGLCGTGSKDIVVDGAFIPAYRTIDSEEVARGESAAERVGRTETVYRLPFWTMFPLGITSAVVGIAEGALACHLEYQRDRVMAAGTRVRDDPHTLYAISEAAAEIAASRTQLLDGVSRLYDRAEAGEPITFEDRSTVRRNQVRCAWRAVSAVDEIFARSGGNAVRRTNAVQRFWRDAHVGLQHAIHIPGSIYHSNALTSMGIEPTEQLRALI